MRRVPGPGVTAGLLLLVLLATAACAPEPEPPRAVASGEVPQPRADWSTGLPALLPGIRACLRDGAAGGAVGVTKAWPIGWDLVGVRLLRGSGERVDCVAADDGGRVFLTERVPSASVLPGERDPLFTPAARRGPPPDRCLESAEIPDGWLSYDACRDGAARPPGPAARREPTPPPAPPPLLPQVG